MTYQALARKWRPKNFAELSGQEHVVRALTNALERGRLHHAYLLTGTRGVGKTTIARILAKSLNCVRGVTATPCGVCPACTDIDAGRFVDLLELDAASNTGIDNMREILDNARYAPTVGRYKVYLIDEVHMLSKQAFNSMLKTLEEPPEHVKFVLATTDPQKIPVTVLSRCLQFNLKQLPKALIAARLAEILQAEQLAFEPPALTLIAHSAKGSMRDALSVLDQAIAYGGGEVREEVVRTMLGVVDVDHVYRIVDALLASDGPALLHEAAAVSQRGLSAAAALDDLASLLHRVAILQTVPAAAEGWPDASRLAAYAGALSPEMAQLAYQIVVQGRADLALAPDEETGMTMTLLRLLAFEPTAGAATAIAPAPGVATREEPKRDPAAPAAGAKPAAAPATSTAMPTTSAAVQTAVMDEASIPPPSPLSSDAPAVDEASIPPPSPLVSDAPALDEASIPPPSPLSSDARALPEPAQWPGFVAALKLSGIALQLAAQTELKSVQGNELLLQVPESGRHLVDKTYTDKLKAALEQALARRLRLRFEVTTEPVATLATQEKEERARVQARTEATFHDDPFVQDVLARFDARIQPNSIKPV